jgi:hypothetical protein
MKNKIFLPVLCLTAALLLYPDVKEEVRIGAQVESRCKLALSTNLVSFTRVSPDIESLIPQNEFPLEVTIKTTLRQGERIYLRIQAEGDLIESKTGQKIDANNISWKVSGMGFRAASLSSTSSKAFGVWERSGIWKGTITFYLKNRLDYAPGTYHLVVTVSASSF